MRLVSRQVHVVICFWVLITWMPGASWADMRNWTDATGRYHVRAELVDFKDGQVTLRKENSETVSLPIEKLSPGDRAFVQSLIRPKPEPAKVGRPPGEDDAAPRLNRKVPSNNLLIAEENGATALRMGDRWHPLDFSGKIPSQVMWCTIDHRGRCWLSGQGGVLCLDGQDVDVFGTRQGLPNKQFCHVFEDTQGRIWLGSFGGGMSMFEGGKWRTFTADDGLSHNEANACAEDRAGRIWIGCDLGVSIYDNGAFDKELAPQLSQLMVKSVEGDSAGRIYLGCIGALVIVHPNLTVKIIGPAQGLPQRTPQALLADSRGRVWAGTWGGGVVQVDQKTFEISADLALPDAAHVRRFVEDAGGTIWVAAIEGLWMLARDRWQKVTPPPGISKVSLVATVPDEIARQLNHRFGKQRRF